MRPVNWIILFCVLVTVGSWYVSSTEYNLLFENLAYSTENLLQGKVWTPITALFLHADLLHLGGNMVFLYVFGSTLEDEFRDRKALTAFLVGGILSFMMSTFFYDPNTLMMGASAAIFTLTAIVMLVKPLKFSFFFFMPQGLVAILYFAYNLAAIYLDVQGNVAYISHVIGFMIGVPFGILWSEEWKRNLVVTIGLLILYYLLQMIVLNFLRVL